MSKYVFEKMYSSEYSVDPIFGSSDFILYGDAASSDSPVMFEVNGTFDVRIKYCLVDPSFWNKNRTESLKLRRYILHHDYKRKAGEFVHIYFVGDIGTTSEISSQFSNHEMFYVTVEGVREWYPKNLSDVIKYTVNYIFKTQKTLGEMMNFMSLSDDALFVDENYSFDQVTTYKRFLKDSLENDHYIKVIRNQISDDVFVLTSKAITTFVDQNKEESVNNKAFIALKFDGNGERINAIANAISESGFEPVIMNRVETNNWIMPEIFNEIKSSRFVVADFSLKCDGAYYEAGYAAALEKPVIHLFDRREETEDNKLHFDIAQKSTIFYKDLEDLKKRLKDRIEATIK